MAFPTHHARKVTHALWALLPILLALLLSMTPAVQAKEAEITSSKQISAQASDTFIVVNPATSTVNEGDIFVVTIEVQAGTQDINGASAYLDFDPSLLQVQSLTPVSPLAIQLQKTFDNNTGEISYSVGTFSAPYATGTFDLLEVEFQALADTPNTALAFHTSDPRKTALTSPSSSGSVLTGTTDGTVVVGGSATNTPVPPTATNTATNTPVPPTPTNTPTNTPLEADFSCTPLSGSAPLAVTCSDSSTGGATAWAWEFGDGTTSSDQNPTHTYNMTGTHTIGLIVTGPDGSDTQTRTNYISVGAQSNVIDEDNGQARVSFTGRRTIEMEDIVFNEINPNDEDFIATVATDDLQPWLATHTAANSGGWHVTLSATGDFSDGASHSIALDAGDDINGFTVRLPDDDVTGRSGSNSKPKSQALTKQIVSTTGISILSAATGTGEGIYDFIPQFELFIPATTIGGNYSTIVEVKMVFAP